MNIHAGRGRVKRDGLLRNISILQPKRVGWRIDDYLAIDHAGDLEPLVEDIACSAATAHSLSRICTLAPHRQAIAFALTPSRSRLERAVGDKRRRKLQSRNIVTPSKSPCARSTAPRTSP